MSLKTEFTKQAFFKGLKHRAFTFLKMMEHLDHQTEPFSIIETGCAWDKGNWEGQGQSTLIWDWVAHQKPCNVYSFELSEENIEIAVSQTTKVNFIHGDSVSNLSNMPAETLNNCKLLYLDSYDWHELADIESAFHHASELMMVWRELPSGCMISVDDRHTRDKGKHWLVHHFMENLKIEPVFVDYQIGWIKP